ncbi:RNA polymerase sigma factor, partial [Enterocloster clostridioformis]|uniref:RNA polymerase sigma factor n=2 Tax=Enterocloster clostridioformis TaxID=1531 RepID=UPI003D311798
SFFDFFANLVSKSHLPFPIWCGKRNKHFSRHNGKGVRLMKPSDFQKTVQCRFESCLKKVVRHVVKDYQQELKRRKEKEVSFCELPEIVVENLAVWDDYETDYTIFNVYGNDIRVYDDELAEALKKLPERKRNNVLMYYFLELSDTKIADILNITRSGAFRSRYHALEALKKILGEGKNETHI